MFEATVPALWKSIIVEKVKLAILTQQFEVL